MIIIRKEALYDLLEYWNDGFSLYSPIRQDDSVHLLPYERDKFTLDYINFTMSIKEQFFGQKEKLFSWKKDKDVVEILNPQNERNDKKIFFGVRPCDSYSIDYLDLFFYERFKDDNYTFKRENSYIVALNCINPGDSCFCSSMATGPFAERGFDIALTPLEDYYLVEYKTQKGHELIEYSRSYFQEVNDDLLESKERTLDSVKNKFKKKLAVDNPREVLENSFDNEIWKALSKSCMGCTGCTSLCPTCTCFNVVDEDYDNRRGSRVRYWDSCQSDSFTRNAGGHNPRNEISRVRYRIYDKMKYIDERFNLKGCTGCGRCIEVCPVFIDIVEIMEKLNSDYKNSLSIINSNSLIEDKEEVEHNCSSDCSYIYTPRVAIIKEIIQETSDIKRFVVEYEDKEERNGLEYKGQFYKITVFGVGEIAISIPFGDFKKDSLEFYIKKAGKVTTVLHNMKIGDRIGLRGPFGKGFPHKELKGRDILIIGSGVGLAPVRTSIENVLGERGSFGKVVIIASAKSYESLIYREDLEQWSSIDGVNVQYALAKPTDSVNAHVGYINELLTSLNLEWSNTTAIICATPSRIKSVANELINLGMDGENILTSLETHMRCGIGKCGHCKVGSKYMCVDGPVFSYKEMLTLPPEF